MALTLTDVSDRLTPETIVLLDSLAGDVIDFDLARGANADPA